MKTGYSEDRLNITGIRNTRTKTSEDVPKSLETLPIDLFFEILSRLPAKSIARCRCVSKPWASILRRPDFTEVYLTRSCAHPKLLYDCLKNKELFIFSSSNPDKNSCPVVASYHMSFPFAISIPSFCLPTPVNGLMCLRHPVSKENEQKLVICNPSTGQSLTLPSVFTREKAYVHSLFGYDPIEKQHKVLTMTWETVGEGNIVQKHQILTLGNGDLLWRTIECCVPHFDPHKEICINGVLYYKALVGTKCTTTIVAFDVRSEKFSSIKLKETESFSNAMNYGPLLNYNGRLGLFMWEDFPYIRGTTRTFMLWVLEDAYKQEWSEHTYVLPPLWQSIVGSSCLQFFGVTRTKEFVLAQFKQSGPFYVFYYNTERNTVERVEIQGMEAFVNDGVYIYPDHIENVKLLQVV